jgi:hypothetical protein
VATTATFAADIMGRKGGVSDPASAAVHCREPMSSVPRAKKAATGQAVPSNAPGGIFAAHELRCRCGFKMDAPAGRRPSRLVGRRRAQTL